MAFADKIRNKAQELAGRAKEKTGEVTGNKDQQTEGQTDQAVANLKQAGEKVKDMFRK